MTSSIVVISTLVISSIDRDHCHVVVQYNLNGLVHTVEKRLAKGLDLMGLLDRLVCESTFLSWQPVPHKVVIENVNP